MMDRRRRIAGSLRRIAGPLFAAVLFALAVRLLIREAKEISWETFVAGWTGVPPISLAIAACLVALNYGMLISYDLLGLRYLRKSLPLRRVALVGFLGYSLGNNLGSLLAAAPIRFRLYGRWGIPPHLVLALISILGLTFWSGVTLLGGIVLVVSPIPLPPEIDLPFGTRTLGIILLAIALGYLLVCVVWRQPWPVGNLRLRPPTPGLMAVQASVASVDLMVSATALYLVLPAESLVPYGLVLAAYLVGIAVSMITQVPGGLGVLELILLKLLRGVAGDAVLASLLIFRLLYYVIPLLVGMTLLSAYEIMNLKSGGKDPKR